jgi:hypothetical protein
MSIMQTIKAEPHESLLEAARRVFGPDAEVAPSGGDLEKAGGEIVGYVQRPGADVTWAVRRGTETLAK